MDNKELLLVSGGNPYPEATHWLTVANKEPTEQDTIGIAGFSHPDFGSEFGKLEPMDFQGKEFQTLYDSYGGTNLFSCCFRVDSYSPRVRITNLLNGLSSLSLSSGKDYGEPKIGLEDYIGQRIPLKIEAI